MRGPSTCSKVLNVLKSELTRVMHIITCVAFHWNGFEKSSLGHTEQGELQTVAGSVVRSSIPARLEPVWAVGCVLTSLINTRLFITKSHTEVASSCIGANFVSCLIGVFL